MDKRVTVEICVSDPESAVQAAEGGAHRIELCDDLAVGGTTPSAGAIAEACRRLSIPVHVLVRPRAGDFVPSAIEFAAMRQDVQTAKRLGAAGLVFGLLRADGTIDRQRTAELVELARPSSVTFHKAFDQTRDHAQALDVLIALGVDRLLSSGCRPAASEGCTTLGFLVERARGKIAIMAGGRLAADNLEAIITTAGVREVHLGSAVTRIMPSAMGYTPGDGSVLEWNGVDAAKVRAIVDQVAHIRSGKPESH